MTRTSQKKDMIGAIASLVLFACAFFLCRELKPEAALWPNLICVLGTMLSIAQFIVATIKYKKLPKENAPTAEQKKAAHDKMIHALIVVVVVALWIFLLDKVGFIVVSCFGTLALMCITYRPKTVKEWALYAGIAIAMSVILWFGFGRLLGARLPSGFLI